MSKPEIGIILYTLREPAAHDPAGVLKQVKQIGFDFVQWSGMPPMGAQEARNLLDNAGLKAFSCHCSMEAFEQDFDEEVRFWKTLGVTDVGPGSMMSDCTGSLDAWLEGARRLDTLGARLREVEMRLSYHNHDWEFTRFEGDDRYKLDILYEQTSPENVCARLDIAWVKHGGEDPAAYIDKYGTRCPTVHVKDISAPDANGIVDTVPLGMGTVDWPSVVDAINRNEVDWVIYEQDNHQGDPFENARISYDFLRKHF